MTCLCYSKNTIKKNNLKNILDNYMTDAMQVVN